MPSARTHDGARQQEHPDVGGQESENGGDQVRHKRAHEHRLAGVAVGQGAPEGQEGQPDQAGDRDDRAGPGGHVLRGDAEPGQIERGEGPDLAQEHGLDQAGDRVERQQVPPGRAGPPRGQAAAQIAGAPAARSRPPGFAASRAPPAACGRAGAVAPGCGPRAPPRARVRGPRPRRASGTGRCLAARHRCGARTRVLSRLASDRARVALPPPSRAAIPPARVRARRSAAVRLRIVSPAPGPHGSLQRWKVFTARIITPAGLPFRAARWPRDSFRQNSQPKGDGMSPAAAGPPDRRRPPVHNLQRLPGLPLVMLNAVKHLRAEELTRGHLEAPGRPAGAATLASGQDPGVGDPSRCSG